MVVICGAAPPSLLLLDPDRRRELVVEHLFRARGGAAFFCTFSMLTGTMTSHSAHPIAVGCTGFPCAVGLSFSGRDSTCPGLLGLTMIVGGLAVIGASVLAGHSPGPLHARGVLIACLGLALLISTYTAIDGSVVNRVLPCRMPF